MTDLIERLKELKKLREDGDLTEEEFQRAKEALLREQQKPNPQAQAYPGRKDTVIEAPEEGDTIGPDNQPFELLKRIGSGGQGEVWLAKDLNASQRQGRDVMRALKLLPPELYSRPDYQKLLEREADLACELAHPHIINIFYLGAYRLGRHRQPMLIMEYLQGEDLRSKILAADGRPLDWEQLMRWFGQAAEGLKYAWEKHRIIHRDLKPENLFITEAGDLKLLDFGLAWRIRNSLSKLSRDQAQSQGTGTIEYLPPEAFLGGTPPSPKHDVYALACVLYEALTGDPPFSPELSRSRQAEQMPPRPAALNNARWQVLKKGLAYKKEDRPVNAWEWLHALKETARSPHEAQRNAGKKEAPNTPDSAKGSIQATRPAKSSSGNDEQDKLIRYLNSVGKKAFVDRYETFHSYAKGSLSKQACIDVLVKEGVSNASGAAMRCSNAQRIFAMNKQRDALKIVAASKRLPAETIAQARKLLEERGVLRSPKEVQGKAGNEGAPFPPGSAKNANQASGVEVRRPQKAQHDEGKKDAPKSSDSTSGVIRATAHDDNGSSSFSWGKVIVALVVVMSLGGVWQQGWFGDGEAFVSARIETTEPEMVKIPGGRFQMGCVSGVGCYDDEKTLHWVEIKPFELGEYEVTFAQWDACVADGGCRYKPGDEGWGRGNRPVTNVSWNDVQEYIKWLNQKTGKRYRLPSESEWEYAARGGTTTPFYTGNCISIEQANYNGRYDYNDCGTRTGKYLEKTMPVGSYPPNPFGLYDMAGNVWEWVQDCYHSSYWGAPKDGSAWQSGDCERRVLRGGSWSYEPRNLRSADRGRSIPRDRYNHGGGFRLARTITF